MDAFAPLPPRRPTTSSVASQMSDPTFWEPTVSGDITIKVPLDPRVVTWASLVDGRELKRSLQLKKNEPAESQISKLFTVCLLFTVFY